MGVGRLIEYVCCSVIISWILYVCLSPRPKPKSINRLLALDDDEKLEVVSHYVLRPDDPQNRYAPLRAWDRHLKLQGLLPIGTNDLQKVGPILQDPDGEYIVYGYTHYGHLTSWRETV